MQHPSTIQRSSITELARQHFFSALNKGRGSLLRRLMRNQEHGGLLDYQDVYSKVCPSAQRDLGLRTVAISQITGSLGRAQDYDSRFMPRTTVSKDRWINIDSAYHNGLELPPVELYKLGDTYFVADGHNRLSVAILHGQDFIEAMVIEIDTGCPFHAN